MCCNDQKRKNLLVISVDVQINLGSCCETQEFIGADLALTLHASASVEINISFEIINTS